MGESTNATIDSVVIEVESTAKDTANGLNSLIATLDKINGYISSSIKQLTSYNSELDNISNKINNSISKISNALSQGNTGTIDITYNNPQNFNSLLSTMPDSTINLGFENTEELKEIEAAIDSMNQELGETKEITDSIDSKSLDELENKAKELENSLNEANNGLKEAKDKIKKLEEEAKNTKNLEKLQKTLLGFISFKTISKIFDWMGISFQSAVKESTDYIENLNLLHVSLEENADAALEFSNNLQDVLGIDSSDTIRYISLFNTLAEGFGVASDKAYIMSKNLTQLTYDMSSYLNLSIEESMQKLKSGFSGEIEPMRAVGVALDQATLQQTAYKLGIDQTVSSMNRLQKTQLIYYQIMTSTTKMQGDMGRTLLQPANAIRVMKQQFTLLARAIGNIFIPIIMKVIPYVMVLTQWLTKAAQAIANFFGFEIDVNGWTDSTGDISAGIEDIGDSANGTKKELEEMLAPFDELNVIDFGKDSGGSSGVSTSGGELDVPLPEYDMLSSALSRNLDEVEQKLKNIAPLVATVVGILAGLKLLNLVSNLSKLTQGLSATSGVIKALSVTTTLLKSGITGLIGVIIGFSLGSFIDSLSNGNQELENFLKTLTLAVTTGAGLALISTGNLIPGFALLGTSVGILIQDFNNANNEVDIFKGKSTELKEALQPTMDALQSTQSIIAEMNFSGLSPTQEEIETLQNNFNTVIEKYKETELAQYEAAKGAIMARQDLSAEEKEKQIAALDEFYGQTKEKIQAAEDEVNQIIEEARNNGWTITKENAERVAQLIEEFGKKNTELISSSQKEANEIWANYETSKVNITEEKFGEILKESANLRDQTIADADKLCNETVASFREMLDSTNEDTRRMAENNIANAKLQRNKTVEEAEKQHAELVMEMTKQNQEISENFDLSTGEQLSFLQRLGKGWDLVWQNLTRTTSESTDDIIKDWSSAGKFTEEYTNKISDLNQENINLSDTLYDTSEEYANYKEKVDQAIGVTQNITDNLNSAADAGNDMYYAFRNINNELSNLSSKTFTIKTQVTAQDYNAYATGGFPETGEAFIARENGPELVGRIGNKSAVINNSQIIEGVSQGVKDGVSEAMQSYNNKSGYTVVNIGDRKVYSGYGEYANEENNMYGTNVIRV